MIKVSAVKYLNTLPFIYGLRHKVPDNIRVTLDIPSDCARKVISGEADVGLVPVAAIPAIPGARIITPYCIGADGRVDTVMLYSEVPLNEVSAIRLDYQSRTSVMLTRLLARELWRINPEWLNTGPGFESQIKGNTAGLVIGDRTFDMNSRFEYVRDLATDWKQLTGLPFTFACWVTTRPPDPDFESAFTEALGYGVNHIAEALEENPPEKPETEVALTYLTGRIQYNLDAAKMEAMELFFNKLSEMKP